MEILLHRILQVEYLPASIDSAPPHRWSASSGPDSDSHVVSYSANSPSGVSGATCGKVLPNVRVSDSGCQ